MPNSDVLVLYVIDRSGSMGGMEEATCEGVNIFKKEQAGIEGDAYISIILFDDDVEVPFVAWNARDLPDMTPGQRSGPNPYWVRGSTALRDATATAIKGGEEWLKNNSWFDGRVVVTVWTDGGENRSTQWSASQLRELMEQKKADGWTFIFQGAGDAWVQAEDMGFDRDHTYSVARNDALAYSGSYTSNSAGVSALRSFGSYDTGGRGSAHRVADAPSGGLSSKTSPRSRSRKS